MPIGLSRFARSPPVSVSEFRETLLRIWHPFLGSEHGRRGSSFSGTLPHRIGLCISGGPDSMALAFLFSELNRARHDIDFEIPKLELNAFIVDHSARENSRDEANRVSQWLSDLGISSRVLPISWPEGTIPSKLSDFESQARAYRFDLFTQACCSSRLSSLFLGHHQDDQAETVLMRLLKYRSIGTAGLVGIPASKQIPGFAIRAESMGTVFDESMPVKDLISSPPIDDIPTSPISDAQHAINDLAGQIHVAHNSVTLYRPLLHFSKARLISTCQSSGISYVTDPTNFNPTLTSRNAYRHFFRCNLPKALQPASLISLGEKASSFRLNQLQKSNELLSKTRILSFDLRSGTIQIRFPDPTLPIWRSVDLRTASFYLRRLLSLVSPSHGSRIQIPSLLSTARNLFPQLRSVNASSSDFCRQSFPSFPAQPPKAVTVAGVLITPSGFPCKLVSPYNHYVEADRPLRATIHALTHQRTYTLARQPPARYKAPHHSQSLPFFLQPDGTLCQTPTRSSFSFSSSSFSSAFLFDHRFLFRLRHTSSILAGSSLPHSLPSTSPRRTPTTNEQSTVTISSNATTATDKHFFLRSLGKHDRPGLPLSWRTKLHADLQGFFPNLPAVVCVDGIEGEKLDGEESKVTKQSKDNDARTEFLTGGKEKAAEENEREEMKRRPRLETVIALPTLGLWRDLRDLISMPTFGCEGGGQELGWEWAEPQGNGKPWWEWDIVYKELDVDVLRRVKWGDLMDEDFSIT